MTRYTPLWQQGGTYAAQVDRNLVAAVFPNGGATGAIPVTVANTMNVSIPPGRAAVPLQAGANTALCAWDAAEVVTSTAAPAAGNTRIDVVILQVRDPQLDAGVNNDFLFQVLAGAPSTTVPVAPTVPANALAICRYTVGAAVANLNGVTIVDMRAGLRSSGAVLLTASLGPGSAGMPADGYVDALIAPSFIVPVPTTVIVRAVVWFGNQGGGWVNGVADIIRLDTAGQLALTGAMQNTVPASWVPIPVNQSWDVPAGSETAFKVRYNQVQHQSVNGWYDARCTYQVVSR